MFERLYNANILAINMPFQFRVTVSRVGNSNMLILPKPLCDQYGIKKGDKISLIATDSGLYMPLRSKPIDEALIEAIESDLQKQFGKKAGHFRTKIKSTR